MDLKELQAALEEIRPEDTHDDWGLRLVMAMAGSAAEGLMRIDSIEENMEAAMERSGKTESEIRHAIEAAKHDLFGALLVAVAEYATENEVDLEAAVDGRLSRMRGAKKARDMKQKWEKAGIIDKDSGQVNTDLDKDDDWTYM